MTCALVLLAVRLAMNSDEALGAAPATSTTSTSTADPAAPRQPREVKWQNLADNVEVGEMDVAGHAKPLSVTKVSFDAGGGTVRVLDLPQPGITQSSWEISGKVKYANVIDNGYIEMWSHFPDGTAYFTRTLDTSGPMGVLHGKSEWREFRLPFFSQAGKVPSKLEVNIVLPSGGTVWLGPATLKEVIAQPPPAANAIKKGAGGVFVAPWWGNASGGRIGGVLGTVIGLYGALIGILAAWSRTRRMLISFMMTGLIMCAVLLMAGLVALGSGQPYAVWYPLVLGGGIGGIITGGLLPVMKRRIEEEELRRMTALDA